MEESKSKLPKFKSLDELAAFLDEHDSEDFEWREIKDVEVVCPDQDSYRVELDRRVGEALAMEAHRLRTTTHRLANKILHDSLIQAT